MARDKRTANSWRHMLHRCKNPKHHARARYSEAGVTVCQRWEKYENFLEDMGQRPAGTSIDRYPDPAGNYEPKNCRWATPKQQVENRRMKPKKEKPKPKAKKFPDVKNKGLRLALEAAGGYPKLAGALGISRQSVHKWEAVPDRFAVTVEQLYGIPRNVTAPHLYEGMASA